MTVSLSLRTLPSISGISADDWDRLAGGNPFTSHRFLKALEDSGSVGRGTGWQPIHIVLMRQDDPVAVAPLYVKSHSQGEYIFDHAWAEAYRRAGGDYYPKLQCAVPFTPATGPRLLAPEPALRQALLQAMMQLADRVGCSGAHVTFCTGPEADEGVETEFLRRVSQQFHWINRDYGDFDGFLAALSSRKRKTIRKERERAQAFGGTIRHLSGDQLRPEHWDAFWRFYQDTGSRKWGHPYLTRAFFDCLHHSMRDDILLVLAERDGRPIAGALNFIGTDTLYGRYWGCVEDHPFLHFELCYYQAIEWAIARGLHRVEAGAQGEHKLARGYEPIETHSLHRVRDPGFQRALAEYLSRERVVIADEIEALSDWTPFRKG